LESTSKDVVICAGRRFGKSSLCAYIALKTLLEEKKKICLVAPTYGLTGKVFDYLVGWIGIAFPNSMKIQTRPFPVIRTTWGSRLDCKSAENPEQILGESYDLTIIDECSRISEKVFNIYIFPTTHRAMARTIFISTPFGKNWFYKKYTRAQEEGGAFHFTSLDGVEVDQKTWELAKSSLPSDIFQQEYEAAFLADAARVFRNFEQCVQDCLSEPKPNHRYVMGLDVAQFNDFTVLTILDKDTHDVVFWDRFHKIPYTLQKQRIVNAARKYGAQITIDAMNVGAALADDLRAEGLFVSDFKAVGTISKDVEMKGNKQRAIEKLTSFFEERNIQIPPEPILIGELDAFGYNLTKEGNLKYGAPEGLHDDCVSSLYLAVWGLQGKKRMEIRKVIKSIPPRIKRFQYL